MCIFHLFGHHLFMPCMNIMNHIYTSADLLLLRASLERAVGSGLGSETIVVARAQAEYARLMAEKVMIIL